VRVGPERGIEKLCHEAGVIGITDHLPVEVGRLATELLLKRPDEAALGLNLRNGHPTPPGPLDAADHHGRLDPDF
jgi:hypothetical protein